MGKFGAFIGCSNYPQCNYIKNIQSLSIADDSDVENNGEKFENKLNQFTSELINIYSINNSVLIDDPLLLKEYLLYLYLSN